MTQKEEVKIYLYKSVTFHKLSLFFQERKSWIIVGIIFLILGIIFFILGIRQISAFDQLYFYWSFTYVNPFVNLAPGSYPGFPSIVKTYEILIPWALMGVASFVFGVLFLAKGSGKCSFRKK